MLGPRILSPAGVLQMNFNRSDIIGNRAQQTGKAGDGTVFVSAVEPVVRIRAGANGEKGLKHRLSDGFAGSRRQRERQTLE
jgi:hypothetical protein